MRETSIHSNEYPKKNTTTTITTMTDQEKTDQNNLKKFLRNVIIKGIALFLILSFSLALIPPQSKLGRISLYNIFIPGRVRLPFGENASEAYNLSLYDMEAMFASHEIDAGSKPETEFRVMLIGDSATWGTLLKPAETISGLINHAGLTACDGRIVRAYNLAYPSMSLTKDLMILDKALKYQPDLILWPLTLESFPDKVQIPTPLVANNPGRIQRLIEDYDLAIDPQSTEFNRLSFWDQTLIGRRRKILDAIQLQLYGVLWAATGIDQTYPNEVTPAQRDFEADDMDFHGWPPNQLPLNLLAFESLDIAAVMAGDIPVAVINEPVLISNGENSEIRYNFFYPRWAYDQYRNHLAHLGERSDWAYLDLWDAVPENYFTNSAVHLNPEGSQLYFDALLPFLKQMICR